MATLPPTFSYTCKVKDLSSPTLAAELAADVAKNTPTDLATEDGDLLSALVAQGVALAVMHKLEGAGELELVRGSGAAQVIVNEGPGEHAIAQPLEPERLGAIKDARAAAARASARAKVVTTIKSAAGAAVRAVGLAKPAPVPGAVRGKPAAPAAATRPTLPPPARR